MRVFIVSDQALSAEESQIDCTDFIVVRLDMAEILRQNSAQRCWVVDQDLDNLRFAKALTRCMTVMVGAPAIPRPVGIDTYVSSLQELLPLIFPQQI